MSNLLESLPALQAQLEEAENEARDARVRADALRSIIEGIHALNGQAARVRLTVTAVSAHEPPTADAEATHPVGREAVRAIVADRPGIWTLSDLVDEHKRREWFTTRKSIEVAVQRLCRLNGEARRVRTGVYEFPAAIEEETAPPYPVEALPVEEAMAA